MKSDYIADLMDTERALFQLIYEHSSDMPKDMLDAIRAAYKETRKAEEIVAAEIRKMWRVPA